MMVKFFKLYLTYSNLLLLFLVISIFSSGIAFFSQYVLGFIPCAMCYYERIPYYFIIIISSFGLCFHKHEKKFVKLILVFTIINLFLSGYHISLERGILKTTKVCKSNLYSEVEETKNIFFSNKRADCSISAFKIFKLSFAEWNFLVNIMLMGGVNVFFYILNNFLKKD